MATIQIYQKKARKARDRAWICRLYDVDGSTAREFATPKLPRGVREGFASVDLSPGLWQCRDAREKSHWYLADNRNQAHVLTEDQGRFIARHLRHLSILLEDPSRIPAPIDRTTRYGMRLQGKGAWIARVDGTDPVYGLKRAFLDSQEGTAMGTRTWYLEPGIYEFSGTVPLKGHCRGFLSVMGPGNVVEISRDEVFQGIREEVA